MNVDTATTPFWVPDKSLIECICALTRVNSPDRLEEEFLKDTGRFFQACGKLLGMFFNVRHLNEIKNAKKIKFQAWSREDAIASQFEEELGGSTQPTSVKDYFHRKYGIRLQFPRLPLAKTRAGEFPLELCYSAAGKPFESARLTLC
jgi:eukaryotic translation initiation factor 2C